MPDDDVRADNGLDDELSAPELDRHQPTASHDPTGSQLARQLAGRIKGRRPRPRRGDRRPDSGCRDESAETAAGGRDPRLLGAAVRGLVEDQGWQADVSVHGVFARWDQIVGREVAAHCVPETCRDGELTIRTDSTAWANQVRLLAPTLVRRLNEELGHDTITKVIVLAPAAPSWRKGFRTVRGGRGPRDTYG